MNTYLFLDFETTGLDYRSDEPTEIAFIITDDKGEVEGEFSSLIRLSNGVGVPEFITDLTGITNELLENEGRELDDVREDVKNLLRGDEVVVAHHASFDLSFLSAYFGIKPERFICTRVMWSEYEKGKKASLEDIYKRHVGKATQKHRALGDAYMLRDIFFAYQEKVSRDIIPYYNVLKETKGRPLSYVPTNAIVKE